jgi:prepilin-type N-terminal cleavage/methylation domain-containing protein
MDDLHKDVGCSLWLGALLVAVFAAEWILLRLLFAVLADRVQLLATIGVIVLTILGGWVAVYQRVQRRARRNRSLRRPSEHQGERGDSLIELLIAISIISLALVVFITSLSTGAMGVGHNTRRTTATNLAASQLETIKASTYITSGTYATIASPAGYTILLDTTVLSSSLQQVTATVLYGGEILVSISNYKANR